MGGPSNSWRAPAGFLGGAAGVGPPFDPAGGDAEPCSTRANGNAFSRASANPDTHGGANPHPDASADADTGSDAGPDTGANTSANTEPDSGADPQTTVRDQVGWRAGQQI